VTVRSATKRCGRCQQEKPVDAFGVVRSNPDGRRGVCKECFNGKRREWIARNHERVKENKRREYELNRDKYKQYFNSDKRRLRVFEWKLQRFFGITIDDFEAMMDAQAGRCAICRRLPDDISNHRNKVRLHVDHDHKAKKGRGLLCNTCNMGLGAFRDSIDDLKSAIRYLEESKQILFLPKGNTA